MHVTTEEFTGSGQVSEKVFGFEKFNSVIERATDTEPRHTAVSTVSTAGRPEVPLQKDG